MLIALPNADGSFTATLFLQTGEESFDALTTREAVDALFEPESPTRFRSCPASSRTSFESHGHLETIRCEPWAFEDHALVWADAAHAIVPFPGRA